MRYTLAFSMAVLTASFSENLAFHWASSLPVWSPLYRIGRARKKVISSLCEALPKTLPPVVLTASRFSAQLKTAFFGAEPEEVLPARLEALIASLGPTHTIRRSCRPERQVARNRLGLQVGMG